jgi:hypothetical protein
LRLGIEQQWEVPTQQHGSNMAMVGLGVLAVRGGDRPLQTIATVPVFRGVRLMTVEHQGGQPVPRRGQSLVALQAAIQVPQTIAHRLRIHQGGDAAERIGTGERTPQKAPPKSAGLSLLDGIETPQASEHHHQQAPDDDEGDNPGLRARVAQTAQQRAQRSDLVGPGEQASEHG